MVLSESVLANAERKSALPSNGRSVETSDEGSHRHDPVLWLAMTIEVACTPFETVGDTGQGVRRIIALTGGTFEVLEQTAGTCSTSAGRGAFPHLLRGHPQ